MFYVKNKHINYIRSHLDREALHYTPDLEDFQGDVVDSHIHQTH